MVREGLKVSAPQEEAPAGRVGGISPACPWKKVEFCDCQGLGEGKDVNTRDVHP